VRGEKNMPKAREEHCDFAVLDKSTGKCTAHCYLNDGDTDCIGIKHNPDPKAGAEVPLGDNLKLGGM
jgi:hypothetical protein